MLQLSRFLHQRDENIAAKYGNFRNSTILNFRCWDPILILIDFLSLLVTSHWIAPGLHDFVGFLLDFFDFRTFAADQVGESKEHFAEPQDHTGCSDTVRGMNQCT